MNNNSDRKKVMITGVTSGIGSAIALAFAKNNWDIVGHFNSVGDKVDNLKKELDQYPVELELLKADLLSQKEIRGLIDRLEEYKIDALVNNAGTCVVTRHFSELSADEINCSFMVNAVAPMLLSSSLFMKMKERGFGRIVNVSSIAAKYGGSSHSMHYGCAKMAQEGITKTLAREGAGFDVLVNTVRPGVIDTDFHKKFPKDMKKRIDMIPMKKIGTPEDVAGMAYYLGSDKNKFITNEIITIAGGE